MYTTICFSAFLVSHMNATKRYVDRLSIQIMCLGRLCDAQEKTAMDNAITLAGTQSHLHYYEDASLLQKT